ncbi:Eco57I restriction-modification methylase domain-containing protein [Rhizobium sp. HT1-10]|uniref:Eco57I restriction-modification methylase domain-containing protein n=1 Tax=Rhizobium sp. HT1-10 TaxID=3111638 RepID=UPI003C1A0F25
MPALLKRSRDAQALVSTALAEQVLGALHELLRGLDAAEPALVRDLSITRPDHLYEGLLTVLMRLVFVLYAEDRDLLPSLPGARAREIYETSYSVRGFYAKLTEDATLNPDTMDERRGSWGGLLALFRMIHKGHSTGFVQARSGKLFDPDEFPFLEGRAAKDDVPRILHVSDGCLLRILEGLMTIKLRGQNRERLSYRTLDVEQIGSVYETVMGFTAQAATSRVLAIKAGKNNKTPVFVALDDLLTKKGKDRIKSLKEDVGRVLTAAQAKPVEDATTVEELVAALDSMVDERGSPKKRIAASGTPILQPTDERRRTGSHYTPRSLTAPIVKHALEPAFARLGQDATPEQVLDLKVCDLAMGSGAFLVEACRAIGERLTAAWARWPDKRPKIPADEDEELHARRLVAQRCLYGIDKNPRAVDLARLSLWLATLARDHEFTFLDHALKCGDSLVGLTKDQIAATHWDESRPPTFVGKLVSDHLREAEEGRARIRNADDSATEAELRPQLRAVDAELDVARYIGDGIVAAFFHGDKAKKRIEKLVQFQKAVQSNLGSTRWIEASKAFSLSLRAGEHGITPFHWQIEFPEVFTRDNGGFDAIVGNPPFAGKNTIIAGSAKNFLPWLQTLHAGAHGNADLVAHFFRRAFGLLRQGGVFGLIATNTIGQGDTRASGLAKIIAEGGVISRATRRLKWPGEAAVVVSVVHIVKGAAEAPVLDTRPVRRISAYLVEGDLDTSPLALAANSSKAFVGSYVLGMGFTFDDAAAAKGQAESLETMRALIAKEPRNKERIFPFIGGEEVNTDPQHRHERYVIDFFDRPLKRDPTLRSWVNMDDSEIARCRVEGIVPADYPNEVAEDWPDLIEIIRRRVKPERDKQTRPALKTRWWQYAEKRPGLYRKTAPLLSVFVNSSKAAPQYAIALLSNGLVYSQNLNVFALEGFASFACLQTSAHEIWARFVGTTMKDDLTYTIEDCFRTFPFPVNFETVPSLEAAGDVYHAFRAQLMVDRNQGLTKTYNRFHARAENAADIVRLRALHHEMDVAVLRAYGWKDLADRAAPEFIEQDADEGKTPKTRLDWPTEFKDEVLARLLALNATRAAEERAAGLVVADEAEDEDIEEGDAE